MSKVLFCAVDHRKSISLCAIFRRKLPKLGLNSLGSFGLKKWKRGKSLPEKKKTEKLMWMSVLGREVRDYFSRKKSREK
tara:strand:- start:3137 stop:3373 length:237 start_codon:yes stop_codon:yes gene_type:complete